MPQMVPTKITASKLLGTLYVYAKNLQLLDEELARSTADANIATCRQEYLESIWGTKLGQVFTSDFTITEYRAILTALAKVSLQDSVRQNIKDTVAAYFPLLSISDTEAETYTYDGDFTFAHQPVLNIISVEVDAGAGYVVRPSSDYMILKDVGSHVVENDETNTTLPIGNPITINGKTIRAGDTVYFMNLASVPDNNHVWLAVGTTTNITSWTLTGSTQNTATAIDKLHFIANEPTATAGSGTSPDSVSVTYEYDTKNVDIVEWWKNPELMEGYDWQNTSFFLAGGVLPGGTGTKYNDTTNPERGWAGNFWNGTHPWVPDIKALGYILFGVQIFIRGVDGSDLPKIENYVTPALNTFVKPAGIYYRVIIANTDLLALDRALVAPVRAVAGVTSILGYGIDPYGSAAPAAADDLGYGSPSLPEYAP